MFHASFIQFSSRLVAHETVIIHVEQIIQYTKKKTEKQYYATF